MTNPHWTDGERIWARDTKRKDPDAERGPDGSWSNVGRVEHAPGYDGGPTWPERATPIQAAPTAGPEVKLNILARNVYADLHEVCGEVESLRDDLDEARNGLMELSIVSGTREDSTSEWAEELEKYIDGRFQAQQNGITLAVKERIARDAQLQEQIRVGLRRLNALQASYDGLLARCNAVEERLLARVERTEKAVKALTAAFVNDERPDPTRRTRPEWMGTDAP